MTARPRTAGGTRLALRLLRRHAYARVGTIVILALLLVAIFADLLASQLPVLCGHEGKVWVLPAVTQPAELAGTDCDAIARTPGSWQVRPLVCQGPRAVRTDVRLAAPFSDPAHPLGTDASGRDVFARLVHGTRTSLTFALGAAFAFALVGSLLGAIAGFRGGALDALLSRVVETMGAFPTLVLALGIQALVPRPSIFTLLLAICLTRWAEVFRLVRAEVQKVATLDYVMAARALGASPVRVLIHHVGPNARGVALMSWAFGIPSVILAEASLTFLRVGHDPSTASWGEMLSEVRDHPAAWWLLAFPGLLLFATVAAYHVVGEALRDALDPRARSAEPIAAARPTERLTQLPPSGPMFESRARLRAADPKKG